MTSLCHTGFAANAVGKIAITTNNLIILFGNNTQPGLEGLESFDTDTPLQLNMLYSQAQEFLVGPQGLLAGPGRGCWRVHPGLFDTDTPTQLDMLYSQAQEFLVGPQGVTGILRS